MKSRAAVCVACALLAVACGRTATEEARTRRVRVAAAADLRFALDDLVRRFEPDREGIDVEVSYGSSGTFYAQLLNQAPFDMFLSADIEYPRRLADRGMTLPGSAFTYAVGRLVIWARASSTVHIEDTGLRALGAAAVKHVAIANPEHAPYGRAAVAAMRTADVYEAVRPKLVYGENVEQALQFAQSGAADVGIVALSLALAPSVRSRGRYVEVPLTMYPHIVQGGAILRWVRDADATWTFRAFLVSDRGRAILKEYGFSLPGD